MDRRRNVFRYANLWAPPKIFPLTSYYDPAFCALDITFKLLYIPRMSDPYSALGVAPQAPSLPEPKPEIASPAEMRSYEPTLGEKIKGHVQDFLMRFGANPQVSEHLAGGLTSLAQFIPPVGMATAVSDMQRSAGQNDILGTLTAAVGAIPGVGPESKMLGKVAQEAAPAAKAAVQEIPRMSFAEFQAGAPEFKAKPLTADSPQVQYIAKNIEDIHAQLGHSYPALQKKLEPIVNELRVANDTGIDREKILDQLDQALGMAQKNGANTEAVRRLDQLVESFQDIEDHQFLQHMSHLSELEGNHKHYNELIEHYTKTPPEKAHEIIQSLESMKFNDSKRANEVWYYTESLAAKDAAKVLRQKYPEAAATVDAQNAYRAEKEAEFKKKHPRLWKRQQETEAAYAKYFEERGQN